MWITGGVFLTKFYIYPFYMSEIVENLALKPTEIGQIARIVFLFKCPDHPNYKEY